MQEWIPDSVWLNVVALSSMTALHDIPDSVFRNDGLWRQWYDAEAPETANVPDYEDRLSKFERMCVVKVMTQPNGSLNYQAVLHHAHVSYFAKRTASAFMQFLGSEGKRM